MLRSRQVIGRGDRMNRVRLSLVPGAAVKTAGALRALRHPPPRSSPNASGFSRQISTRLWMCAHLAACGGPLGLSMREFANQKALVDYAERKDLVFVWARSASATGSCSPAELILTNVLPDDTVAVRGVEHHTFICSGCHVTEHRIVFIKGGRETDSPPMPMQAARRIRRASTEQNEHVAAPGLLSRVVALLRGQ